MRKDRKVTSAGVMRGFVVLYKITADGLFHARAENVEDEFFLGLVEGISISIAWVRNMVVRIDDVVNTLYIGLGLEASLKFTPLRGLRKDRELGLITFDALAKGSKLIRRRVSAGNVSSGIQNGGMSFGDKRNM